MSRIASPEVTSLDENARRIYENMPMNVTLMMLGASPEVAQGFFSFAKSFYSGSTLSPRLREIAALRIGYVLNAEYELFQHIPLAERAGISRAEMKAISEGGARTAELGPEGAAVVAFTDDILQKSQAGDEALCAVREFLDDRQIIDLTLAIGCYSMVSWFLKTTGVELDQAPLDDKFVTKPKSSSSKD